MFELECLEKLPLVCWVSLSLLREVMFDYPTVADLTDYIVAQFSDADEGDEATVGGLGGPGVLGLEDMTRVILG